MSKRAFIVNLNMDGGGDPEAIADQIRDAVLGEGLDVINVRPWASPKQESSPLTPIAGPEPEEFSDSPTPSLGLGGLGL